MNDLSFLVSLARLRYANEISSVSGQNGMEWTLELKTGEHLRFVARGIMLAGKGSAPASEMH